MYDIWQKLWSRRYAPYIAACYIQFMQRIPGFDNCRNKLFVPEGSLHALYFRTDEFKELVDNYSAYLLNIDLNEYPQHYEQTFADYLSWAEVENQRDWSELSMSELVEFCNIFTDKNIDLADWQFFAFVVLEGIAKEVTEHYHGDARALSAIGSPERFTKITNARRALLDLVEQGKTDEKTLLAYQKEYAWLPMYEFIDEPLTLDTIRRDIGEIKDPSTEKATIIKTHEEQQNYFQKFKETVTDPLWRKKVEITHTFSYLKEMRDDYRRPYYLAFRPFWNEVSRRTGLSLVETNYLLPNELIDVLQNGSDSYLERIKKRQTVFSLVLTDGELTIHERDVGPEYLIADLKNESQIIQGVSAYGGVVHGRVKIMYHKGDFAQFSPGDILVTAMTHPEFLPIMKQAAGIVTDEGGITCHAAIVARELGKPCVIATRNATRVLHDGNLVEVDGEQGMVRRI